MGTHNISFVFREDDDDEEEESQSLLLLDDEINLFCIIIIWNVRSLFLDTFNVLHCSDSDSKSYYY